MAINYGVEILVDTTVSADKKATLVRRIIQLLESESLSIATGSWATGDGQKCQSALTVGGATTNFGISVIMDSAVVGTGKLPTILRRLIQGLESETLTIAHLAAYNGAGTRTYDITITLS